MYVKNKISSSEEKDLVLSGYARPNVFKRLPIRVLHFFFFSHTYLEMLQEIK